MQPNNNLNKLYFYISLNNKYQKTCLVFVSFMTTEISIKVKVVHKSRFLIFVLLLNVLNTCSILF